MQTDTTASANTPANIVTAQTLDGITAQIAQNQKDLTVALQSNKDAPTQNDQGVQAADELLSIDSTASATAAAAAATATAATGKATGKKSGKANKNGRSFVA